MNSNHRLWAALLLCFVTVASGCQDIICLADSDEEGICEVAEDDEASYINTQGPFAWDQGVAYLSNQTRRLTLLNTSGSRAAITHIDIPPGVSVVRTNHDNTKLILLSPETEQVLLVDPTESKIERTWDVGSPFQRLSESPDGKFLIADFGNAEAGSAGIVTNANELAIIRVDEEPEAGVNPQSLTLRSFGSRPEMISFAPPFTVYDDAERRFALITSRNYVTLLELEGFDAEDPNANELVVHLTQAESDETVFPIEVTWTEDDPTRPDDMFAFLRASGSDDIVSLNLLPTGETDSLDRPKLRPSINRLPGGQGPSSMAQYQAPNGARKLITVNRSQELAIIDVATSDSVLVPLEAAVSQVVVYRAHNRTTGNEESFALLYGLGGLRTVYFVELSNVEAQGNRAITPRALERSIESLEVAPDGLRTIILHPGRTAFSIMNLERQDVRPLDLAASINSMDFVDSDYMVASYNGLEYISLTHLPTAHTETVRLDAPAVSSQVILDTNTILVDHGTDEGRVTLLPLNEPTREAARTYIDFVTDDLLNVHKESK